jgi:prevent-host-death family protein
MATTAGLTELRDNLSEVLDTVEATNEEFVITRHGRPVAVILSFDEYESLVESLNILSHDVTMDALAEAESDIADGRVEPA